MRALPSAFLALTVACSGTTGSTSVGNSVRPQAEAVLPCFGKTLEVAGWHQLARGERVLAFDVVGDAGPPPGWPDGWTAGTCRVVPKYNDETTLMDYLVQDRGKTIATITDGHVDFYVATPLAGAQPGQRVDKMVLADCIPAFAWKGNRVCRDREDRVYIFQIDHPEPVPADTILAVRVVVAR